MCSRAAATGLGILLGVALATEGCGKKGPPLPPLRAIPQAARDLAVVQRGNELVFEFGYPASTVAGATLGGLEAVELLAYARPPAPAGALAATGAVDPREFAAGAQEALRITGSELTSAVDGDRVRLRLPLPAAPTSYAVRSVGAAREGSALSNIVTVTPGTAPAAPTGLAVAGSQDGVRLAWNPVGGSAGTRVYRRDATRRAFGKALTTVPAGEASLLDTSAQFGQRYVYSVTAFVIPPPPPAGAPPQPPSSAAPSTPQPAAASAPGATPAEATATTPAPAATVTPPAPPPPPPPPPGPPIESPLAGEKEIHHVDRFPPPPPARVVALADRGRVRVVWQASGAKDVAGYAVFRHDGGSGDDFRRLNADPIVELETTDTTVVAGARYRYRVAAIDTAGNLGEPSAVVEAAAR